MKMNLIAKILIAVDVIFCITSFILIGLGYLPNVDCSDIAKVGTVIMSPELLVSINKICEKFQTTSKEEEENKKEEETK